MCAPQRRIGRILSLGFPLPGSRVDNFNFITAPAFFDYDALVVNPEALGKLIDDTVSGAVEPKTFTGRIVRDKPSSNEDVPLAEILLRRRGETQRLLDNGGVVVAFGNAPRQHRVDGAGELDDLYWLGAHAPSLIAGEGTHVQVSDYEHPLAAFVHAQSANIAYRAHVDTGAIERFEDRGGRVFARSYGGAAIGVELPCERGRVIVLPALKAIPSGDPRYVMAESLQADIRRMIGVMAEGRPPYWLSSHAVPGATERAEALRAATAELDGAQAAVRDAEASYEELARYERLLWQEGALGLEPAVHDALRLLGVDVYASDPAALEVRAGGASLFVEIDASQEAVDMAPHHRLRQRIERAIERGRETPQGLLIVNGYRLQPPAERPPQATDALAAAASAMNYAIVPATMLFDAVVAKLNGDDATVATFKHRIVTETGLLA